MKVWFMKALGVALFIAVTIPFFQTVTAQSKSAETAPALQQGTKWPYEKPIFYHGKLYGRFHFQDGLAKVIYQQKVGFVDSSFIITIPLTYEDDRDQERYHTAVVVDRVAGLHFQDAYSFKNSRAIVQQNDKWGVIDKAGKTVIPFQYLYIHRMLENYFRVNQANEFDHIVSGILDLDGATILPVQYVWFATPFASEAELLAEKTNAETLEKRKKLLKTSQAAAIKIARKTKFYQQNHWLYPPQVTVNADGNWQIVSTLMGYTKAGKCKYTNGCTTTERKTMLIDGATGKVLDRSVSKTEFPNYE